MSSIEGPLGIDWRALALTTGMFLAAPATVAGIGVATQLGTHVDTSEHNLVIDDLSATYAHLQPIDRRAPLIIDGQPFAQPESGAPAPRPEAALESLDGVATQMDTLEIPTDEVCDVNQVSASVTSEVADYPPERRDFSNAEDCLLELIEHTAERRADFVESHTPNPSPREYYLAAAALLATELALAGFAVSMTDK